jgi:uncharacterized phage protein (TIGR02218 family)
MKPITTQLQALFATRQFQIAGLYSFALVGGGTLNYCSGDRDIYWNSTTYGCGGTSGVGPYFDRKDNRAKLHQKIGTAVDTLLFDVIPGTSTIDGESFLSFVRQGGFDGAELTLSRTYWAVGTAPNAAGAIVPVGTIVAMVGRVAEVDAGRSLASFTVNSHLELLNIQMPRNLYQSGCVNTLFDSGCTLNMASFGVNGSAASGTTAEQIDTTSLSNATGYFDLGQITFTSGVNNGVSRTIKAYVNGSPSTITLIAPFPSTPAVSDMFTVYPGCDKSQATCGGKFSNLLHFRGEPYIPVAETAI